uniref:Uncharacterized protein n=1 Tax=Arundo donax TaxID=35708 RepID=A0A0A9D0X1_ARUDO
MLAFETAVLCMLDHLLPGLALLLYLENSGELIRVLI